MIHGDRGDRRNRQGGGLFGAAGPGGGTGTPGLDQTPSLLLETGAMDDFILQENSSQIYLE